MIWKQSRLYRLWVVGGLAAIVFVVVRVGISTKPGDEPPYLVFGAAVGIYLMGILLMQGVALLRTNPTPEIEATPTGELPQTPQGMQAALTLPGADGQQARSGAKRAHKQSIGLFIPTALIAILLPLGGYLYISGTVTQVWQPLGETGPGIPLAALPGLAMVLVMVLMLPFNMRRAREATDDYNSGLGLRISATPKSILLPRIGTDGIGHHVVGPTVMQGERYGRQVMMEAYSGRTAVLVAAPTEPFRLTGTGGRVQADGPVPDWVSRALAKVPSDSRWHKVSVEGGPDGIRADRKGSALDSDWLVDLWLAEVLADAKTGA